MLVEDALSSLTLQCRLPSFYVCMAIRSDDSLCMLVVHIRRILQNWFRRFIESVNLKRSQSGRIGDCNSSSCSLLDCIVCAIQVCCSCMCTQRVQAFVCLSLH